MRYEEAVVVLVKARQRRALSLRRFSVRAGYAHQTLTAWELMTRTPSTKDFFVWAEELGYEIHLRKVFK